MLLGQLESNKQYSLTTSVLKRAVHGVSRCNWAMLYNGCKASINQPLISDKYLNPDFK